MKITYTKLTGIKTITSLFILFLIYSCNSQFNSNTNTITVADYESEIKNAIEEVYDYYIKSDLRWVDFYADKYTFIRDDGSARIMDADSLLKQWQKLYKKYDITVLNHGEPTVYTSGNQALHYNTVSEIFVNKTTKDTIQNEGGTWIALWEKQKNNSWKIVWETYQYQPN